MKIVIKLALVLVLALTILRWPIKAGASGPPPGCSTAPTTCANECNANFQPIAQTCAEQCVGDDLDDEFNCNNNCQVSYTNFMQGCVQQCVASACGS